MFDLPGNELFDGFIDFCNQLAYQLNYILLASSSFGSAIPFIYALSKDMCTLSSDIRYPHDPSDGKDWRKETYINRIQFLLLGRFHLEPPLLSSFDHISRLVYQHFLQYSVHRQVSSAGTIATSEEGMVVGV